MSKKNIQATIKTVNNMMDEMKEAFDRIESTTVSMSTGVLNIGPIKNVNTRDIAITKRKPVDICCLVEDMKEAEIIFSEINKYPHERVKEKCLKVFRVRCAEYFQQKENITKEEVVDAVKNKVKDIISLSKEEYEIKTGRKWIKIDIVERGFFRGWLMVNAFTGDIHQLLGYGKADPNRCIGNIFKNSAEEIIAANASMNE